MPIHHSRDKEKYIEERLVNLNAILLYSGILNSVLLLPKGRARLPGGGRWRRLLGSVDRRWWWGSLLQRQCTRASAQTTVACGWAGASLCVIRTASAASRVGGGIITSKHVVPTAQTVGASVRLNSS